MYADDYTLVRSNGAALTKEEVLTDLRKGDLVFKSIELMNERVRLVGPVAILTGDSWTIAEREGIASESRFRLVAVYVETEGSLRLLHFQSTDIPAIPNNCARKIRSNRARGDSMETDNVSEARKRFVGVWTLERFTERSDGTEEFTPLGEKPLGLLIYTTDGFVSAQLMRAKRESFKTDPWEAGDTVDGVDLTKDYIAYCGRYEVDEESSEVIHLPLVALLPNLIHQEQHRSFTFEAETLTLVTTRRRPNGSVVASTLLWQRSPLEMV